MNNLTDKLLPAAGLPWLAEIKSALVKRLESIKSPHALLLTGSRGLGKAQLAQELASIALCQAIEGSKPCGHCKSCHLLHAGSHPDFYRLSPEEGSKVIKIDQVRTLTARVQETAQLQGRKVVVIEPPEALNINAANALLKVLEEPPGDTLFILVSSEPGRLMATIRSRCQPVSVPLPPRDMALAWLQSQPGLEGHSSDLLLALADGAPLRALSLVRDDLVAVRREVIEALMAIQRGKQHPVEIAGHWSADTLHYLDWIQSWLEDLLRYSQSEEISLLKNKDLSELIQQTCQHISLHGLYLYLDQLQQARVMLLSGHNPNKILLLEQLLIQWKSLVETSKDRAVTQE